MWKMFKNQWRRDQFSDDYGKVCCYKRKETEVKWKRKGYKRCQHGRSKRAEGERMVTGGSQDKEGLEDGAVLIQELVNHLQRADCYCSVWAGGVMVTPTRVTPSLTHKRDDSSFQEVAVLPGWTVCWCSGRAAWTKTPTCQKQACGSSSGRLCTSPTHGFIKQRQQNKQKPQKLMCGARAVEHPPR